jgi:hypothetical protein
MEKTVKGIREHGEIGADKCWTEFLRKFPVVGLTYQEIQQRDHLRSRFRRPESQSGKPPCRKARSPRAPSEGAASLQAEFQGGSGGSLPAGVAFIKRQQLSSCSVLPQVVLYIETKDWSLGVYDLMTTMLR